MRHTDKITIDPDGDSLQDVAAKLNSIAGITASIDSVRRTLTITAQAGFSFDFAGRADDPTDLTRNSQPDETGILSALGIGSLF